MKASSPLYPHIYGVNKLPTRKDRAQESIEFSGLKS
jgi:hypothetical protein